MADEKKTPQGTVQLPICSGKIPIPTDEEQAILKEMRAVKDRVRDTKQRISRLESGEVARGRGDMFALVEDLDAMKAEWRRLDQLRESAARRRMVALGHETEDA